MTGWEPAFRKQALVLATYALVAAYGASEMRFVSNVAYPLKWVALCGMCAAAIYSSFPRTNLSGSIVVLAFLPWYAVSMIQQLILGPTARGIGVAGGHLGMLLLAFVLMPAALQSMDDLDEFERWAIHALICVCVVGVLLGLTNVQESLVGSTSGRGVRLRWGFRFVNSGGYLGFIGGALTVRQLMLRRWRFFIPFVGFLAMMASTQSRGAVLCFIVSLGVFGFLELTRKYGGLRTITTAAASFGLIGAVAISYLGSFQSISAWSLNQITSGRIGGWRAALDHLSGPVDWLFGQGAGRNVNYIGTVAHVGGSNDSLFVDLITRSGLLGLSLWLFTIAVIFSVIVSRFLRSDQLGIRTQDTRHIAFAIGLAASACVAAVFEGSAFSVGVIYPIVIWSCVGVASFCVLQPATRD